MYICTQFLTYYYIDMKYLAVIFYINCDAELFQSSCDLLADVAGEAGFETFEDTPNGIKGYVQRDLFNKEILDNGICEFPICDVKITYTVADAEDENWNEAWENAGFEPINIDDKVIIYDANHRESYVEPDKITIGIGAKLAFGTGSHQTTRMIISCLLGMSLADKRVIDCGCGTGILGITALKLGAKFVFGYDIDEWSVNNAHHNAKINGAERIVIGHGGAEILGEVDGKFDVIMANLNCNILLNDMHILADMLDNGGRIIMSGFYEEDINKIVRKGLDLGLVESKRMVVDNWACLVIDVL